ncbi:BREX system P-loop protein BrxC [uncultured Methanobrevibacter sp.]|uniref:BREX system P-loop protein BrxC n=1 Tax=uncultured Methanobrevibacter sp. TaxID=253161 RepID=UPI0025F26AC9|nr:BREX system P-loop protein BrxC [uncultured Methanobrevibacter sp.]
MIIKDMFKRPIDRYIGGVIKTDNKRHINQEFEEYVITKELLKYFDLFFEKFSNEINNPTSENGVWISGFYGSGKSHFLKILSYILDNKYEINGKKPIDFFIKDEKITDKKIISNMENSIINNDVSLFNISSKAYNYNSVKDVFINQFNELVGFSSRYSMVADFERKLTRKNKYDLFKKEFEKINGNPWVDIRDEILFYADDFMETNIKIDFLSENEVNLWFNNFSEQGNKSIEDFAKDVKEYCEMGHNVIFSVDEIGQFIADNVNLMLELQAIVEELSDKCNSKAWVIVTSQEQLNEMTERNKEQDFSKIQGRFKTRINLSSSNIDEIIKLRILEKKSDASNILSEDFNEFDSTLKNIIDFEKSSEKKVYSNINDYIYCYPFIPYQFELIHESLIKIRRNQRNFGGYFSEGERSSIEIFQSTLNNFSNKQNRKIIPLYEFYDSISVYCIHSLVHNIHSAENNEKLNNFDLCVLKSLFIIKYLDDDYLSPTLNNITTLMISNIDEDKIKLKNKINDSLSRLIEQVYVHKNGEFYYYLTEKEQDINLEIKNQIIDSEEINEEFYNYLSEIYNNKKLKIQSYYSYSIDQLINDDKKSKNLAIRYITSSYSFENNINKKIFLKHLSEINNEVIVFLNEDISIYNEIIEKLKIDKFLSNKNLNNVFECEKLKESNALYDRIKKLIYNSIKDSTIYISGNNFTFNKKNPVSILDDSLDKLFENIYSKWKYMDFNPTKEDIHNALSINPQQVLEPTQIQAVNALDDLDSYLIDKGIAVTLKDIIVKYSDIPYGYNDNDISWLVATLFAQKRISLILNDSELFINSNNTQEIYDYITSGKNSLTSKKLFLSRKISINPKKIKVVKNLYMDLSEDEKYNYSDEELMIKFKEIISLNQVKITNCIREIRRSEKYPGFEILDEYNLLSNELLSKNTLSNFYDYVFKKEDDFADYIDDLNVIFEFYRGNQIEIFDKSCSICDEFKLNEILLNNSDLNEIINKITYIISLKSPYSKIKDLSNLNNDYYNIFNSILHSEHEKLLEVINEDYLSLMNVLDDELIEHTFKNDIERRFHYLKRDLDSDRNLHSINGKIKESENIKIGFLNEINTFKKLNDSTNNKIDIYINELLDDEINISNEEEMELFLEKIKKEVKKELDENKIVRIINN